MAVSPASRWIRGLAISLIAPVAILTAAPSSGDTATAAATGVDLDGYWRFALGDDPAYADEAYDDSGWAEVLAPEDGGQYEFDSVNGIGWLRKSFILAEATEGTPLWASMGVIDDADEVYINGTLVGKSGAFPPNAKTAFFHHRLYAIPDGVVTFGADQPNLIAVRVNDTGGGGGISRGPLGVFTRDEVRRELWGVTMTAVSAETKQAVTAAIDAQAAAIAASDIDAYAASLDAGFFHAGHDVARQVARMERVTTLHPGVDRVDEILDVGRTPEGLLVAEVHRTWSDAGATVAEEPGIAHAPQTGPDVAIEFLYFDPDTLLEVGNHARFYRDFVDSEVSNVRREFNVFLPPSYFDEPELRYPSVYHLHGAGGNNRLWEGVDLDQRVERLIAERFIDEMIVVMPSGRSVGDRDTWYANSSVEQWRTMFYTELLPQIDATYRTIDDRDARGISGWSMGGHGAFTVGWARPDLFGSIASLSGALDLPPLAGSATDLAVNAADTPNVQVNYRDPLFLRSYCYWLYAGEEDDFAFDEAARAMMAELAAKTVIVEAEIKPGGQHNGHTELPGLTPAFRLHSLAFQAHDEVLGCQATVPLNSHPDGADDLAETTVDEGVFIPVLDNDSDVDHDDLRLADVTDPQFGTARVEFDGTISYQPDPGFVGTDTFEYSIADGRAGTATATVTVTVADRAGSATGGRVHGAGHWDDEAGHKVSFKFEVRVDDNQDVTGKLEVKDKDLDVKIDTDEITWLGSGAGIACNGVVLDGVNTFAFTAIGKFQSGAVGVDDAEFFACGIDNGKPGTGDEALDSDVFYVEVTAGGGYATSKGDDVIDGGNIHLHEPIVATATASGEAAQPSAEGATVIELDPMFADDAPIETAVRLTATVHHAADTAGGGEELRLVWETADGVVRESTVVTDALGVAVFTVVVPLGDTEFVAWVDDLDSNPVWVAGT